MFILCHLFHCQLYENNSTVITFTEGHVNPANLEHSDKYMLIFLSLYLSHKDYSGI